MIFLSNNNNKNNNNNDDDKLIIKNDRRESAPLARQRHLAAVKSTNNSNSIFERIDCDKKKLIEAADAHWD